MFISSELESRVSRKAHSNVITIFSCQQEEVSIEGDFLSICFGEKYIFRFTTKNRAVFKILESKLVLAIINDGNTKYVFDICSIEIKKEQNYTVTVEALKYEKKVI